MYDARLTKVESNYNNLRTNSMEGQIFDLPKVGVSLIIVNDSPLDKSSGANGRVIFTSNIVEVNKKSEQEYEFKTQNSIYKLEILGEVYDNTN